jgi:hypothetical protein
MGTWGGRREDVIERRRKTSKVNATQLENVPNKGRMNTGDTMAKRGCNRPVRGRAKERAALQHSQRDPALTSIPQSPTITLFLVVLRFGAH